MPARNARRKARPRPAGRTRSLLTRAQEGRRAEEPEGECEQLSAQVQLRDGRGRERMDQSRAAAARPAARAESSPSQGVRARRTSRRSPAATTRSTARFSRRSQVAAWGVHTLASVQIERDRNSDSAASGRPSRWGTRKREARPLPLRPASISRSSPNGPAVRLGAWAHATSSPKAITQGRASAARASSMGATLAQPRRYRVSHAPHLRTPLARRPGHRPVRPRECRAHPDRASRSPGRGGARPQPGTVRAPRGG